MKDAAPQDPFEASHPSPSAAGLWSRLLALLAPLDPRGWMREPADPRESEAFSVSILALAAKLAKADGRITKDEVRMFRSIVEIPAGEERNAARVFDLCGRETTGYEAYARKMDRILGAGREADMIRRDVLDMLFHVALADGEYHAEEKRFLETVSETFRIPRDAFRALEARHVPDAWSPHAALGLEPGADADQIRLARRRIAREAHPDIMAARGMPPEMVAIAHARIRDANRAADELLAGISRRPAMDAEPEPGMTSASGW
jgi:DnaJ like chaperone protein